MNEQIHSDTDRTRSPSPSGPDTRTLYKSTLGENRVGANFSGRDMVPLAQSNFMESPRGMSDHLTSHRQTLKTRAYRPHGSSPGPACSSSQPPGNHSTAHPSGSRRPRPETTHQRAVNMNRKMRIDHIIHQKLNQEHAIVRQRREGQKRTNFFRAMRRIRDLPDNYASEKEESWGPGGLLPNGDEDEDYGEEALQLKKVLERTVRRMEREDSGRLPSEVRWTHRKRKRKSEDQMSEDDHGGLIGRGREMVEGESKEETLDDLDLDLLGESRDEEQDEDSGDPLDDDSDMTEEEVLNGHH